MMDGMGIQNASLASKSPTFDASKTLNALMVRN